MKRILTAVIAALLIAGFTLPARALAFETTVINKTPDSWVWVTAYEFVGYGYKIQGAWCVAPGETSVRHFSQKIKDLRGEVTHQGCSHPVKSDMRFSDPNLVSHWITSILERQPDGRFTWRSSSGT